MGRATTTEGSQVLNYTHAIGSLQHQKCVYEYYAQDTTHGLPLQDTTYCSSGIIEEETEKCKNTVFQQWHLYSKRSADRRAQKCGLVVRDIL